MSGNSNSYTASLRAPEGYHLPRAMAIIQEKYQVFDKFGGHPCAAGFGILAQPQLVVAKAQIEIELALQSINMSQNSVNYNLDVQSAKDILDIPAQMQSFGFRKEIIWLKEKEVDNQFLLQIMSMDPFGQDFMLPNLAFQVTNQALKSIKWLGQEQKHLKLNLATEVCLTFFNLESEIKEYFINPKKKDLWVIAKPIQNCWNNKQSIQLVADKWFII